MLQHGVVRVLSLSTPHPARVHLMDENGDVLCDNKHLRFCLETAHPGYVPFIQTCCPCAVAYGRMTKRAMEMSIPIGLRDKFISFNETHTN